MPLLTEKNKTIQCECICIVVSNAYAIPNRTITQSLFGNIHLEWCLQQRLTCAVLIFVFRFVFGYEWAMRQSTHKCNYRNWILIKPFTKITFNGQIGLHFDVARRGINNNNKNYTFKIALVGRVCCVWCVWVETWSAKENLCLVRILRSIAREKEQKKWKMMTAKACWRNRKKTICILNRIVIAPIDNRYG